MGEGGIVLGDAGALVGWGESWARKPPTEGGSPHLIGKLSCLPDTGGGVWPLERYCRRVRDSPSPQVQVADRLGIRQAVVSKMGTRQAKTGAYRVGPGSRVRGDYRLEVMWFLA